MGRITRALRTLNWGRRGWSSADDRIYHEGAFAGATYDATDDSYPGRVTIRRFADLASQYIADGQTIVDLGCGPGEITVELARRFPNVTVIGVDHSANAIERARTSAAAGKCRNLSFAEADISTWQPDGPLDLVMLFDAFHHILDPQLFIDRLSRLTNRFFMIEPAGNWYGGWQQTLDFDWVAESLFLIRDRVEAQCGLEAMRPAQPRSPKSAGGDPVERRYPLEDFKKLFDGFGLEIQGTTAGIERYGTRPDATSDLRRKFGELAYLTFLKLDETLRRNDLDLGAKHWAIYAERGRSFPQRQVPSARGSQRVEQPLAGPYDARYELESAPREVPAGSRFSVVVVVENASWRIWTSDSETPFFLSSRIADQKGKVVIADGPRTPWPHPVQPGHRCRVNLAVEAPSSPGRYRLLVDGVHETHSWFSEAGVPPLAIDFLVR